MQPASSVAVLLGDRFPALLDIRAAATAIGISFSVVRKWTYNQVTPPAGWPAPVKVNRSTRYRRVDLEQWLTGLAAGEPEQEILPPATSGRRRLGGDQ